MGNETMNSSIGRKTPVCLLTHNHASVICSTLESIMDKNLSGFEIIVSDDYSNDGTWERILEVARGERRIRPTWEVR